MSGPLSRVYGWEIGRRNRRFDRGVGVERIDRPVISVGNLSAGGTGKSPMVRWVVSELIGMGRRPAIAMRGYKAEAGQASDEQAEHTEAMPGVPIVARPDRIAGLRALFATDAGKDIDCVVLDDGFQHRRFVRDLDIVLIDATRPAQEDALIPRGFLREGLGSLARADAVVITRAGLVSESRLTGIEEVIGGHVRDGVPVARASVVWSGLDVHEADGSSSEVPVSELEGKPVFVCCAIGNPDAFVAAVERAGARVSGSLILPDHAPFDAGTVRRLQKAAAESGGEAILVTPKDWVKLRIRRGERVGMPVLVPRVGMSIAPSDGLSARIRAVFSDG